MKPARAARTGSSQAAAPGRSLPYGVRASSVGHGPGAGRPVDVGAQHDAVAHRRGDVAGDRQSSDQSSTAGLSDHVIYALSRKMANPFTLTPCTRLVVAARMSVKYGITSGVSLSSRRLDLARDRPLRLQVDRGHVLADELVEGRVLEARGVPRATGLKRRLEEHVRDTAVARTRRGSRSRPASPSCRRSTCRSRRPDVSTLRLDLDADLRCRLRDHLRSCGISSCSPAVSVVEKPSGCPAAVSSAFALARSWTRCGTLVLVDANFGANGLSLPT